MFTYIVAFTISCRRLLLILRLFVDFLTAPTFYLRLVVGLSFYSFSIYSLFVANIIPFSHIKLVQQDAVNGPRRVFFE